MTTKLTTYWERQLDKLDEKEQKRAKQLPGWRTRRHRRALAALLLLGDLTLVAGAAVYKVTPAGLFATLWLSGLVVGGVAFVFLRILTGRMCGGFSRLLDEREREWRHRVTYTGYQILSYLMVVALLYSLVIANFADGGSRGAMMLSALLVTGTTVPSLLLGWSLPDDDPEDFDEGMGND